MGYLDEFHEDYCGLEEEAGRNEIGGTGGVALMDGMAIYILSTKEHDLDPDRLRGLADARQLESRMSTGESFLQFLIIRSRSETACKHVLHRLQQDQVGGLMAGATEKEVWGILERICGVDPRPAALALFFSQLPVLHAPACLRLAARVTLERGLHWVLPVLLDKVWKGLTREAAQAIHTAAVACRCVKVLAEIRSHPGVDVDCLPKFPHLSQMLLTADEYTSRMIVDRVQSAAIHDPRGPDGQPLLSPFEVVCGRGHLRTVECMISRAPLKGDRETAPHNGMQAAVVGHQSEVLVLLLDQGIPMSRECRNMVLFDRDMGVIERVYWPPDGSLMHAFNQAARFDLYDVCRWLYKDMDAESRDRIQDSLCILGASRCLRRLCSRATLDATVDRWLIPVCRRGDLGFIRRHWEAILTWHRDNIENGAEDTLRKSWEAASSNGHWEIAREFARQWGVAWSTMPGEGTREPSDASKGEKMSRQPQSGRVACGYALITQLRLDDEVPSWPEVGRGETGLDQDLGGKGEMEPGNEVLDQLDVLMQSVDQQYLPDALDEGEQDDILG